MKNKNVSPKIVVLGPPGSGKGTQAEFLSTIFKIPRYDAGDLLRAEAKKRTKRGQLIKKIIDAGEFAPHNITNDLIKEKILSSKSGVIIVGYPRHAKQLVFLKKYFTPNAVIYIDISGIEIARRLRGRLVCSKCSRIYHLIYKKSRQRGVCDVCGAKLIRRADETPEAIKQRVANFKNESLRVIDWYKKQGLLLKIGGDKPIKEISREILGKISKYIIPQKLFIVSGLSGAGKDSIIEGLKKTGADFNWVITTTTRAKRFGEYEGNPYHFVPKDDFEKMIKNKKFVEWAKVYGNYYGTQKKDIENLLKKDKPVILKIDCQGAANVKKEMPDARVIFIIPPSFEILEKRLRGRGTDSEESIQKRLVEARKEYETKDRWDYLVVNEEGKLDKAVEKARMIISGKIGQQI